MDLTELMEFLKQKQKQAQDTPSQTSSTTYECQLCEDRELIIEERDGIPWARECECKEQKAINRMFKTSGLTPEQQQTTLDHFKPTDKTKQMYTTVKAYMEQYDDIIKQSDPAKGIALVGKVGTGKTMLMCAIANHLLAKRVPTMFVVSPDLIADLRSAQLNDSQELEEKINKLSTAPVLILDDVAKEKTSEWVQTQYFRIIDARYRAKLATLFTSNCSFDQIGDKLGEAVMSRLYSLTRGRQVIVDATDYRISGKFENLYL